MKKTLTWFFILSKRQLKNIFFAATIVLLPIIMIVLSYAAKNNIFKYNVGIYDGDETTMSNELINRLIDDNGVIHFTKYSSLESLDKDILTGKINGGYIIKSGYERKIKKSMYRSLISVKTTPNSSIISLCSEKWRISL